MSTGQVTKCLQQLNWLVQRDPLSPNHQFRRVYTLWSNGLLPEMDRTADAALQAWPRHPAVWFARFWTLTFTDRVPEALRRLAHGQTRPPSHRRPGHASAVAPRARRCVRPTRQAAISANVAAAMSTRTGDHGHHVLSSLGAPDHRCGAKGSLEAGKK